MAKLKSKSRAFFQSARLTPEEFAFLKEVGSRAVLRTIPDEPRDRLIKAGYVREILNSSPIKFLLMESRCNAVRQEEVHVLQGYIRAAVRRLFDGETKAPLKKIYIDR